MHDAVKVIYEECVVRGITKNEKLCGKTVCKPGSVSYIAAIVIHLGRPSPDASSNLPGSNCGPQQMLPYLVLLQPGFTLPLPLPAARCALTAPFHPYQQAGGIFSVALSVGLRLPGVTWRLALWSPDFPPSKKSTATIRPSSHHKDSTQPQKKQAATTKIYWRPFIRKLNPSRKASIC